MGLNDQRKKSGPNSTCLKTPPSRCPLFVSVMFEDEIKKNSWINIDEQLDLLFDIDTEKRWIKAITNTGIDFSKFSSFSGNA